MLLFPNLIKIVAVHASQNTKSPFFIFASLRFHPNRYFTLLFYFALPGHSTSEAISKKLIEAPCNMQYSLIYLEAPDLSHILTRRLHSDFSFFIPIRLHQDYKYLLPLFGPVRREPLRMGRLFVAIFLSPLAIRLQRRFFPLSVDWKGKLSPRELMKRGDRAGAPATN